MSFDSDQTPSTSRDWFFPSPSFTNSSSSPSHKPPTRRFSTVSRTPKPSSSYFTDSKSPKRASPSSFRTPSSSPPAYVATKEITYAGNRRRPVYPRRTESFPKSDGSDSGAPPRKTVEVKNVVKEKNVLVEKVDFSISNLRLRVSWRIAFSIVVGHSFLCLFVLFCTGECSFSNFVSVVIQITVTTFSLLLWKIYSLRNQVQHLQV